MLSTSGPDWLNWEVLYWEGLYPQSLMSLRCLPLSHIFSSCPSLCTPAERQGSPPAPHSCCSPAAPPALLGPWITALSVSPCCWQKPQHQQSSKLRLSSKKSQNQRNQRDSLLGRSLSYLNRGLQKWQTEACRSNSVLHGMGTFLGIQSCLIGNRKENSFRKINVISIKCLVYDEWSQNLSCSAAPREGGFLTETIETL